MKRYCTFTINRSAVLYVISNDTMEMYRFSPRPAVNRKKADLLIWLSLLLGLAFPAIAVRVSPTYRPLVTVSGAAALLATGVTAILLGKAATESMLDSYPLSRKRFVPTAEYLDYLKREVTRTLVCLGLMLPFFLALFLMFALSEYPTEETYYDTFCMMGIPMCCALEIAGLRSAITAALALRKYGKVHEGRLYSDGSAFPDRSMKAYMPDTDKPLPVCIDELVLDKCAGGYRMEDVDGFLQELREDLLHGIPVSAKRVQNAVFHRAPALKVGYSIPDVDDALDYLAKRLEEQTDLS